MHPGAYMGDSATLIYYLDYQNLRAAHLEALWGIVDWSVIEERYER